MKLSPRPARTPSRLSDSVHCRLNMYALAAGGVGVLAFARPAEGRVVYTPAHEVLKPGYGISYYLDLNHDGVNDFYLVNFFSSSQDGGLWVSPSAHTGNGVVPHASSIAAALPAGVPVGPKKNFLGPPEMVMAWQTFTPDTCRGPWKDAQKRYLGLRFSIKGETHYGWARLNVNCVSPNPIKALLTGYAYETIPNKAIITGKTKGSDVITVQPDTASGSLGRLALGRK